jgi:uncharacterized 2Fe-2S/4Fe-4S cluster protein (DUF4445 family)
MKAKIDKIKQTIKRYQIDFEPVGRRGEGAANQSLLECAHQLGIGIKSICGGQGKCHACKVKILDGTVSELTPDEMDFFSSQECNQGWRLACQTYPSSNCRLHVPAESITTPQRTQIEGVEVTISPKPVVHSYQIEIPSPSLSDLRGDADRVLETLRSHHQLLCQNMDIDLIRNLSPKLRSWNWRCCASVRSNEVITVGPWSSRSLGLAIDLGTTKIAGYLMDLESGKTLAAKGVMNPQISYGEDIISRITRAIHLPNEGIKLKETVIECLNQLAKDLCIQVDAETEEIVDAVVVGNTAMHHLFLHLPVKQLAYAPFVPAVNKPLDIKSRDVGLNCAPGAYIHLLSNIAGFVGADHTAVLLATEAGNAKGVVLIIDIGTNTEVSLVVNGEITSASCASGPAFEGGHIKDGMRAASGAIEGLRITDNNVQYQTIDGTSPVGICGSGILDALAQLYLAGVLDKGGRMLENHPRVRSNQKQREFVLVSEEERGGHSALVITQKDIRELQLAKAAIRTGIQLLLEAKDCPEEKIDQVIIAGAFGSYIDVTSAVTIGMLPSLPLERFVQVGNAAGMGAKLALISSSKRTEAQDIVSKANYLELTTVPIFMRTFIQTSHLGLYRITKGERKEIN